MAKLSNLSVIIVLCEHAFKVKNDFMYCGAANRTDSCALPSCLEFR